MTKWFVSSDIHSFFNIYVDALRQNGFEIENPSHKVIICGDLMDRGDETVALFEFVKKLHEQGRLIYVRGNHEDLLLDCCSEISKGRVPSSHHWTNGTVKTISHFCKEGEWIFYDPTVREQIVEVMAPVLDFIKNNCVNYAEVGDHVFVHGWIPSYQGVDDFRLASDEQWRSARWENGMCMWMNRNCRVDGKTVVCGHFHCSWGWSHIKLERKEFPNKSREHWKESFEPFTEDGILAIDACTAYSGLCNVVTIEEASV